MKNEINKPELRQLTKTEKIGLSTKEIAKLIRDQIKKEFPSCKFSIICDSFSMGSSITISLMSADFEVIKPFESLTENALNIYALHNYTPQQINSMQKEKYHQLNDKQFYNDYDPDRWNNGVFITRKAYEVLKRVKLIADQYNFNDSDPMTDYFNVNYWLDMQIGKFDKPFEVL